MAAADRLGVSVPVLLLNRVPRATAEASIAEGERRCPERTLGAVAEGAPPQGVAVLNALGAALYD